MRSCHVLVVCVLLLVVLSWDVASVEGRRCTRICEKGRCRPICTRSPDFVDEQTLDETEPAKDPDNP